MFRLVRAFIDIGGFFLQSHQNKFHAVTLRSLTEKFAQVRDPEEISASDRELFEYFADLYKNSNRGIKGRGKDRKITGAKKPRLVEGDIVGSDAGRHQAGDIQSMTSPNGSCGSNSNPDGAFDFSGGQMEEEDESSVDSPYEQQQLPPLRPGGGVGMVPMGAYPDDAMTPLHTDMAKYSLERKY
jgi:hypothetical protein